MIEDRSAIFWSAVLTPDALHEVPGSVPTVPKISVVVPPYFTTNASSPLKEKANVTNVTEVSPCPVKYVPISDVPITITAPEARVPVFTVTTLVAAAPFVPCCIIKLLVAKFKVLAVLFQISIPFGVVPELVSTY